MAIYDALSRPRREQAGARIARARLNALVRLIWHCGLSRDEALALDIEQVVESFDPLWPRPVIHLREDQADACIGLHAGPVALTYDTKYWIARYLNEIKSRGWMKRTGPLFVGSTLQRRQRGHSRLSAETARHDWPRFLETIKWPRSDIYPRHYRPFDLEDLRIDGIVQCSGSPQRKAAYARCSVEGLKHLRDARPADFMPPPPNAGERPITPVHLLSRSPERWAVYLPRPYDELRKENQLDLMAAWIDELHGKTTAARQSERAKGAPTKVVGRYVEDAPPGAPAAFRAWRRLLDEAASTGAFQAVAIWDYTSLGEDPETVAGRILEAARAGLVVHSYIRRSRPVVLARPIAGRVECAHEPSPEELLAVEALDLVAAAFRGWGEVGTSSYLLRTSLPGTIASTDGAGSRLPWSPRPGTGP